MVSHSQPQEISDTARSHTLSCHSLSRLAQSSGPLSCQSASQSAWHKPCHGPHTQANLPLSPVRAQAWSAQALFAMLEESQSRPSYSPSPEVAHVLWMYLHSTQRRDDCSRREGC